jgi:hypothetical protein
MFPGRQRSTALLRHSECHHRRETIAFGRRTNAILERLYLACGLAELREEGDGAKSRQGDAGDAGRADDRSRGPGSACSRRRLFPGRVLLPKSWIDLYKRAWITPGGPNCPHEKALAYCVRAEHSSRPRRLVYSPAYQDYGSRRAAIDGVTVHD